ncbi:MAG TPA: hypothetical protein PK977_03705 [Chitinophagaceae bacterium]|nr:hypothetical protein [Chitinophagaceae bacterium]
MKKLILAIMSAAIFASCSKEKTSVLSQPAQEKKLKRTERVYNGGTPETTDFTYDSQGRLLTEITNDYLYKYSYPGSNQIIVTKNDKTTNTIKWKSIRKSKS